MDLDAIWNGDPAAWREIHSILYGVALAAAVRGAYGSGSTLQGGVVNDIAEDSITIAYRRIDDVEQTEAQLKSFVASIAYNQARAKVRSLAGPRSIEGKSVSIDENAAFAAQYENGEESHSGPETELMKREAAELISTLYEQFLPEDLELYLAKDEGITEKMIAEEHGWGASSVGSRYKQALKRIRKVLYSNPRVGQILDDLGVVLPPDE